MLTCPYCHKPLTENCPSCPACNLSVEGATTLLGPVPLLNIGLTDTTETLSEKQKKSINSAIRHFEHKVPRSRLNIVLRHFDPQYNLSTHLFWLFNTAGLSPTESQFEKNQDLLFALDPSNGRLGLMIGYGLEPFVPQQAITDLLESIRPLLETNNTADAILDLIKKLPAVLSKASQEARETLGL